MRCTYLSALTVLVLAPELMPATTIDDPVVVATATRVGPGSRWVAIGPAFWNVKATVAFGHPAPFAPILGPVFSGFKDKFLFGITVNATPKINDLDGSGAFGFGSANINSAGANPFGPIKYTFNVTATAVGVAGPPAPGIHNTLTTATVQDPVKFAVGSAGTSIEHTVSLAAGTQIQAANTSLGVTPTAQFSTRFGLGDFSQDPNAFWDSTAPSGISDLLDVSIFQGSTGHIDATVTFGPSNSNFSFVESQSAASIINAIESANWTLSNGVWTLGSNLSIEDVTITSLNPANTGANSTLGDALTDQALQVAPEPSFTMLLGMALVVVYLGHRRVRSH